MLGAMDLLQRAAMSRTGARLSSGSIQDQIFFWDRFATRHAREGPSHWFTPLPRELAEAA